MHNREKGIAVSFKKILISLQSVKSKSRKKGFTGVSCLVDVLSIEGIRRVEVWVEAWVKVWIPLTTRVGLLPPRIGVQVHAKVFRRSSGSTTDKVDIKMELVDT